MPRLVKLTLHKHYIGKVIEKVYEEKLHFKTKRDRNPPKNDIVSIKKKCFDHLSLELKGEV